MINPFHICKFKLLNIELISLFTHEFVCTYKCKCGEKELKVHREQEPIPLSLKRWFSFHKCDWNWELIDIKHRWFPDRIVGKYRCCKCGRSSYNIGKRQPGGDKYYESN